MLMSSTDLKQLASIVTVFDVNSPVWKQMSDDFMAAMKQHENESEAYWNSLTKDEQLKAFCAVVRRIYEGDIVRGGTYRYVLYNVFGFEPNAYAPAQMAGYLDIHNQLCQRDDENEN